MTISQVSPGFKNWIVLSIDGSQAGVDWNQLHFFYSIYYGAQATFQLGNNYWNVYRPLLHKTLFDRQQPNGSWIASDNFGPSYATAMSVLALTVEYRFLPIYQRHEENEGK